MAQALAGLDMTNVSFIKFDVRKAEFAGDSEANGLRSRALRAPYMY